MDKESEYPLCVIEENNPTLGKEKNLYQSPINLEEIF